MKRFLTILLAAALLTMLAAVPASAETTPRFYLEGPSTARVGDTITLSLKVAGQYQAHTLEVRIYFDNTSVRFVNTVPGAIYPQIGNNGGFAISGVTTEGNAVSFGFIMPTDAMSGEGELIKMQFEVISTAAPRADFATEVLAFNYLPVGEINATPIAFTADNLSVTLSGGSGSGTTTPPIATPRPATTANPRPTSTPRPTADPNSTPTPTAAPGGTGRDNGATHDPNGKNDPTQSPSSPFQPNPNAPTEKPGETGAPDVTEDPNNTQPDNTDEVPASTEPVYPDGTLGPDETDTEIGITTPAPDQSAQPEQPGATEGTGENGGGNGGNGIVTGLIIAGGIVAAGGIAALATFLAKRSKAKKKAE